MNVRFIRETLRIAARGRAGRRVWTWRISLPNGVTMRVARMPYTAETLNLHMTFGRSEIMRVRLKKIAENPLQTTITFRLERVAEGAAL